MADHGTNPNCHPDRQQVYLEDVLSHIKYEAGMHLKNDCLDEYDALRQLHKQLEERFGGES